jgi:hypothetical protein
MSRGNLPLWIPMIPAKSERQEFRGLRRIAFAFEATFVVLLLASYSLSAQTPQTPQSPPAQSTQTPAQQSEPDKKKDPAQKQTAPAPTKPHRVITNDDPEFQHHLRPDTSKGEITPHSGIAFLLGCDQDCEHQAKEILQYGPDEEAEWQMQLVSARRDLAKDNQWRELLGQSIQQTQSACNLEDQESRYLAPTGDDYHSRVERARQEQYFASMGQALRQAHDATEGRIENRISEVNALFPVRGAMMQVQAGRIANLDCEDLPTK